MRVTWRSLALVLLPLCLLLLIRGLDHVQYGHYYGYWNRWQTGILDEPAHLSTAVIAALALIGARFLGRHLWLLAGICAGSVLIDLDHIPLYAGDSGIAVDGRPFTHSLFTVVVLALLGIVARRRWRQLLLGLSLGVALHLFRDIATGPGVPLLWPLQHHAHRWSYHLYIRILGVLAMLAAVRGLEGAGGTGARSTASKPA